jgi:hypothetical protein
MLSNLSGVLSLSQAVMRRHTKTILDGVRRESQQMDNHDDKTRDGEVLPVGSCEADEAHATIRIEVTLKLERSVQTRVGEIATSIRSSRVRKGR